MRTFAEKPKTFSLIRSAPARSGFGLSREINSQPPLQRAREHQATSSPSGASMEKDHLESHMPVTRHGHSFSQIPLQAEGQLDKQEAGIPAIGADEEEVETPDFVITPSPLDETETPEAADSCSRPMSMTKVTSGAFQGGLSLDNYYPDLVGRGYWQSGGSAGSWDTGTRAGASAQLFGTVPSPCSPDQFTLEQQVTRRVHRVNGVATALEGTSADDIAKSGRDASRAPFRQEWLGGGLNISMADPPSSTYRATTNKEYIKDFKTSLAGPGGKRTVEWTISLKIKNGSVIRNTIS